MFFESDVYGAAEKRRSRKASTLFGFQNAFFKQVRGVLPLVKMALDLEHVIPVTIEAQLIAHGDGDFFELHTDNGHPDTGSRAITFVYYFHSNPKLFSGGELLLSDELSAEESLIVAPQNNCATFFAAGIPHLVTRVTCSSADFKNARFAINGWIHGDKVKQS